MIDMVRRHEIQVLRRAGHSLVETATRIGVSQSSVQRVEDEPPVTSFDTDAERARREVGRPSKAEPFRSFAELAVRPDVLSVEPPAKRRLFFLGSFGDGDVQPPSRDIAGAGIQPRTPMRRHDLQPKRCMVDSRSKCCARTLAFQGTGGAMCVACA
jgi:hypothetical protein